MEIDDATELFRLFGDETRLRLLHLLRNGEMCVGDIVDILDLPQPSVSRHLAHLRAAGLVRVRRDGLWRHYRLATPRTRLHRILVDSLSTGLKKIPRLQEDRRRAAAVRAQGGCCPL